MNAVGRVADPRGGADHPLPFKSCCIFKYPLKRRQGLGGRSIYSLECSNSPCLNPDFRRDANLVDCRLRQGRYNAPREGG
jgi:hypothetical protein